MPCTGTRPGPACPGGYAPGTLAHASTLLKGWGKYVIGISLRSPFQYDTIYIQYKKSCNATQKPGFQQPNNYDLDTFVPTWKVDFNS